MRMMTGLGMLAALALVGGGPASALTTTTSTFAVNLTIQAQCVINSTAALNFGTLGVLGGTGGTTNNDQTTTVAVQCTNTTPFDIGLDGGTGGGNTTTRKLLNSGTSATVNYTLWQDNGHSTNWGNAQGSDTVSDTGNGASKTYTIYGRIPPQTTPAPGAYTDTVTVTVYY